MTPHLAVRKVQYHQQNLLFICLLRSRACHKERSQKLAVQVFTHLVLHTVFLSINCILLNVTFSSLLPKEPQINLKEFISDLQILQLSAVLLHFRSLLQGTTAYYNLCQSRISVLVSMFLKQFLINQVGQLLIYSYLTFL